MNFTRTLLAAALLSTTVLAQANITHASFVDVAGSISFDGWNELNRNRVGGALTEADLVAGTGSNVVGSGDAVLTRVTGDHYPAGSGLYGGASTFTFTDSTLAPSADALVFQGIINNFSGVDFALTLSFNGGSQALAASTISSVLTGGVADQYTYTWDLSGLAQPVGDYTLTFGIGFSQMLAFQVDQVAAVPEPSTYALLAGGLGVVGFVARRRSGVAAR